MATPCRTMSPGLCHPAGGPFDEALGVQPHQRTSGELQWLGCAFAVFVPFATAARLLGWYCGGIVSPRAGVVLGPSGWPPGHGAPPGGPGRRGQRGTATARGLAAEQAALPLALGADGVMVPFRPRGGAPTGKIRWREIKVGVLARLGQHRTRTGPGVTGSQRRLVAVLGDIEALKPRLWLEALRQGIKSAPQVVWLSDGGRGLWRLFEERFAGHARGILDFYHAAQQLWKGAAAWLDGRTTQARRWFGWARHRLRHGMPDGVLADWRMP